MGECWMEENTFQAEKPDKKLKLLLRKNFMEF